MYSCEFWVWGLLSSTTGGLTVLPEVSSRTLATANQIQNPQPRNAYFNSHAKHIMIPIVTLEKSCMVFWKV